MEANRRTLLGAGLAAAVATQVAAADEPSVERFPVWPGAAPGGAGLTVADAIVERSPRPDDIAWPHVATPMLTVVRPAKPNGAALLLMPGGGYTRVAIGRGGSGLSRMFASHGITMFELLYRLPHDGWAAGPDAPLQDAQRAMRLIRSRAATWRLDPARVGTVGFSAGGHLSARLASRAALQTYAPIDTVDALSSRPIVAGLFFPVVTLTAPSAHDGSVRELFGTDQPDPARARAYSAETDLPADMPPTYVACAGDDPVVPPVNSMIMYQALRGARHPERARHFRERRARPADARCRRQPASLVGAVPALRPHTRADGVSIDRRAMMAAGLTLPFLGSAAGAQVLDMRQRGARGDGVTLDHGAINRTIAELSAAGGGTLLLPAGRYLCFSIRLKSNVTLVLGPGAVIVAADPARDGGSYDAPEPNEHDYYQDFGHSHWQNSLIWGDGIENVAILGPGLIDGSRGLTRNGPGARWQGGVGSAPLSMRNMPPAQVAALQSATLRMAGLGNKAIALKNCRNVLLRDFRVLMGGHFAVLATGSII